MPFNGTQQPRFLIKCVDRRKHRTEKIADVEVLTCLRRVSPVNSFGRKCANCALLSAVSRKILQRGNFMVEREEIGMATKTIILNLLAGKIPNRENS
jgi:hypothetical protein